MSRYPYTEAYDVLRGIPERADDGVSASLSRSDCAKLCDFIAEAIGMDKQDLACKIADHARNNIKGCRYSLQIHAVTLIAFYLAF